MTLTHRQIGSDEIDRLAGFDFATHNDEVRGVWAGYRAGVPPRVPIILGTNTRYFLLNPRINPHGVSFRHYCEDPDVMFDTQLRCARWSKFNLLQDAPLGLPECWEVAVDFQNFYEAAWFGCAIEFPDEQVPDTRPAFADRPEVVLDRGLPDAFAGIFAKARAFHEHFSDRAGRETYLGRPIRVVPGTGVGTDGIMTLACALFGAEFVCAAMLDEQARVATLLEFITTATIDRMRAWRRYLNVPVPQDDFMFADDAVALISVSHYREHILPHHRRLCDAFATTGPRGIHLCGDATRHFQTLRDELNVRTFDTGFPIDFASVRRELGPGVRIQGGPRVQLLLDGSPQAIRDEVHRILDCGVLDGGLFVLREANNLAPLTPLENTEAMYHAGRAHAGARPTGAIEPLPACGERG